MTASCLIEILALSSCAACKVVVLCRVAAVAVLVIAGPGLAPGFSEPAAYQLAIARIEISCGY